MKKLLAESVLLLQHTGLLGLVIVYTQPPCCYNSSSHPAHILYYQATHNSLESLVLSKSSNSLTYIFPMLYETCYVLRCCEPLAVLYTLVLRHLPLRERLSVPLHISYSKLPSLLYFTWYVQEHIPLVELAVTGLS